MVNLETRKKLKEIGVFCRDYLCFEGCGAMGVPKKDMTCLNKRCEDCDLYLPNPTLEELIEAIDEKTNAKWGFEREKKKDKWLVWFEIEGIKSYFAQDYLDNCLAKALIWLHEQEE